MVGSKGRVRNAAADEGFSLDGGCHHFVRDLAGHIFRPAGGPVRSLQELWTPSDPWRSAVHAWDCADAPAEVPPAGVDRFGWDFRFDPGVERRLLERVLGRSTRNGMAAYLACTRHPG